MRRTLILATFLALPACSGVTPQLADPAAVQRIMAECLGSGLFKQASGLALAAIPVPMAGEILSQIVAAEVDRICADPAAFAANEATARAAIRGLAARLRSKL